MLAVATRECTLMVITCCNIRCNQACRPCLRSFLPTTWTREKKPPYANHTLPFRHHYSWNTQWCKCRALFNYLFINAPVLHFPRSKGPRNGQLIIISGLCLAKNCYVLHVFYNLEGTPWWDNFMVDLLLTCVYTSTNTLWRTFMIMLDVCKMKFQMRQSNSDAVQK